MYAIDYVDDYLHARVHKQNIVSLFLIFLNSVMCVNRYIVDDDVYCRLAKTFFAG